MNRLKNLGRFSLVVAGLALLLAPAGLYAQEQADEQPAVTLQQVKDRLKENKKFLDEARKRGKAGDARGLEVALENFNRSQEGLNRALSRGRFDGDVFEREEAFDRVEKATRKHGEVLADLLNKVPEAARPGIERAIENSKKGRETALERLSQAREQRVEAQRRGEVRGQSGANRPGFAGPGGQAGSAGRPGGIGAAGGPPSSAGRPTAPPGKRP
jgi:hypothetical protein